MADPNCPTNGGGQGRSQLIPKSRRAAAQTYIAHAWGTHPALASTLSEGSNTGLCSRGCSCRGVVADRPSSGNLTVTHSGSPTANAPKIIANGMFNQIQLITNRRPEFVDAAVSPPPFTVTSKLLRRLWMNCALAVTAAATDADPKRSPAVRRVVIRRDRNRPRLRASPCGAALNHF
jgi:hypothetical protein